MKRTILVFILTFIICEAFSQTSSGVWNSRTATYSNAEHKITWQLMDNTEWIGRPILEESTLFKVRNDELQVLVQLGATKSAPPTMISGTMFQCLSQRILLTPRNNLLHITVWSILVQKPLKANCVVSTL